MGVPIPGRDRLLPEFAKHACLDGSLVLQTPDEFRLRKAIANARTGDFVVRGREFVADEWGHLRYDLILERQTCGDKTAKELVDEIMHVALTAPLCEGQTFELWEAGAAIKALYESESLKTCLGYVDPRWRAEVSQAAAGSVVDAAEAPHVIMIRAEGEAPPKEANLLYDGAGRGALAPMAFERPPLAGLCWGLWAISSAPGASLETSALCAAFGLCWLVGGFLEFAELPQHVKEYEARNGPLLAERVRSARKRRNARFAAETFGGWKCAEVLKSAVAALRDRDRLTERWFGALHEYTRDTRDAGGLTGAAKAIISGGVYMADKINVFSGAFEQSPVTVDSPLASVAQTLGALSAGTEDERDQLTALVDSLRQQLNAIARDAPERKKQVEAVECALNDLLGKAKAGRPNKTLLSGSLATLKSIARSAFEAAPDVVATIGAISGLIVNIFAI